MWGLGLVPAAVDVQRNLTTKVSTFFPRCRDRPNGLFPQGLYLHSLLALHIDFLNDASWPAYIIVAVTQLRLS